MEWFKAYSRGILYGTSAIMSDLQMAIWWKLLSLANETKFRDGSLRFGESQPMPREWIASLFHRSVEQLNDCVEAFKQDINQDDGLPRLQEWDDGTLFITNFAKYQAPTDGKQPRKQSRTQRDRLPNEGEIADSIRRVGQ